MESKFWTLSVLLENIIHNSPICCSLRNNWWDFASSGFFALNFVLKNQKNRRQNFLSTENSNWGWFCGIQLKLTLWFLSLKEDFRLSSAFDKRMATNFLPLQTLGHTHIRPAWRISWRSSLRLYWEPRFRIRPTSDWRRWSTRRLCTWTGIKRKREWGESKHNSKTLYNFSKKKKERKKFFF